LLDLERESLKVLLSILFEVFFRSRRSHSSQLKSAKAKMFSRCTHVIKDYVLKQNEVLSIQSIKQEEAKEMAAIHRAELENLLMHLSPVIHHVLLEKISLLGDEELAEQKAEMG
jgi:predicted XRE-type DNA-binding protein